MYYLECVIICFFVFYWDVGRTWDNTLGLGSCLWLLIFIKCLFVFLFLDHCHCSLDFCFLPRACPSTYKSLAAFCNSWNSWFRFTFSILNYNIWIEFILCSREWWQNALILYFYLIIYTVKPTWWSCRLDVCYYWTSLYILKIFASAL